MFKTVLIPVDVSLPEDTQIVLKAAKALTAGWDCALHVTTVVPDVGMAIVGTFFDKTFEAESRAAAGVQLDAAVAEAGIIAVSHVVTGRIYDRVIATANTVSADLILIGAHQPEFGDYLLGSNAARIVRHAKQSVMVLRT